MADLTLTNEESTVVTFTEGGASFMSANGRYHTAAAAGPAVYARDPIVTPGVDGVAIKRHGFRERTLRAVLFYVADNEATCWSNLDSDSVDTDNRPVSVSMPDDQVYPACDITLRPIEQPKSDGAGKFYLRVAMEAVQRRTS